MSESSHFTDNDTSGALENSGSLLDRKTDKVPGMTSNYGDGNSNGTYTNYNQYSNGNSRDTSKVGFHSKSSKKTIKNNQRLTTPIKK